LFQLTIAERKIKNNAFAVDFPIVLKNRQTYARITRHP
jgi:hypothetical protein